MALQGAGEEAGHVRFDGAAGGSDEFLDVFCGNVEPLIRKNESCVCAEQLLALAGRQGRSGDCCHFRGEEVLMSDRVCPAKYMDISSALNRVTCAERRKQSNR